jgi:hypothetical protein
MAPIHLMPIVPGQPTLIVSLRVRNQLTFQYRHQRNTNSLSTLRRRRRLGSKCHKDFLQTLTKSSNNLWQGPLLALSRHPRLRRTRPLSGVKQTCPGVDVCFRGRYWE